MLGMNISGIPSPHCATISMNQMWRAKIFTSCVSGGSRLHTLATSCVIDTFGWTGLYFLLYIFLLFTKVYFCFLSASASLSLSISLQTEIAKRLNVICAQLIPFLSQEVRWDQHTLSPTAAHHETHTCHIASRRSVIDNSHTHIISPFLFLTHMQSLLFLFSLPLIFPHMLA